MMWGWDDDKRLGDWGIVDRHRKGLTQRGSGMGSRLEVSLL